LNANLGGKLIISEVDSEAWVYYGGWPSDCLSAGASNQQSLVVHQLEGEDPLAWHPKNPLLSRHNKGAHHSAKLSTD